MSKYSKVEVMENIIETTVKAFEISPLELAIALNNACFHGKIWEPQRVDWGKNGEHLKKLYEGIETMNAAGTAIQNGD